MAPNIYSTPGATEIYFALPNKARADLLANPGACVPSIATDLLAMCFKDHLGTLHKLLKDASTSAQTPDGRVFFADSDGAASSALLLAYAAGRLAAGAVDVVTDKDGTPVVTGSVEGLVTDSEYDTASLVLRGRAAGSPGEPVKVDEEGGLTASGQIQSPYDMVRSVTLDDDASTTLNALFGTTATGRNRKVQIFPQSGNLVECAIYIIDDVSDSRFEVAKGARVAEEDTDEYLCFYYVNPGSDPQWHIKNRTGESRTYTVKLTIAA